MFSKFFSKRAAKDTNSPASNGLSWREQMIIAGWLDKLEVFLNTQGASDIAGDFQVRQGSKERSHEVNINYLDGRMRDILVISAVAKKHDGQIYLGIPQSRTAVLIDNTQEPDEAFKKIASELEKAVKQHKNRNPSRQQSYANQSF